MLHPEFTTRRSFLKQALTTGVALGAAGAFGCRTVGKTPRAVGAPPEAEGPGEPPPAKKYPELRVACIGTGGIGGFHLENALELGVTVPCFCDVDTSRQAKFAEAYPQARTYQDYRRMFDREHKNFDAVMIGAPDHHHFPATMMAMQLGKHVYTQKPLTHTPWEARQLTLAAQRYPKLVTQMGNQGHALEGWRIVVEWIQSGALGEIVETHTWTDRPIWPQNIERPEGEDPVPPNLDWDCWLGPAPTRAFKEKVYHPFNWRGWWDFGCGALGDMACHTMDGIFWALEPGYPTSVEPVTYGLFNDETYPKASVVRWQFPRRGRRRAFTATWYDGGLQPQIPPELEFGRRLTPTGNLFIGTKASLLVQGDYGESPRIFPESKMKEIGRPPKKLERSPGHVREWVMACVGEQPPSFARANFLYSGPMAETVLLGNIAIKLGRRLDWNGEKFEFTNVAQANPLLTKEYREGWRIKV